MSEICVSKLKVLPILKSAEGSDCGHLQNNCMSSAHLSQKIELINISPQYFVENNKDVQNCTEIAPGMKIQLIHSGQFQCTSCGKNAKKLFEAYCYPCFINKASADRCVMSPEKCHYFKGTCREPLWGESFCFQPHYVYLAFTDKFKVGITRENQIPTRWVDQGATMASAIAKVTSRFQAGIIEKLLSAIISDKSHWLKMLQGGNSAPNISDFKNEKSRILSALRESNEFKVGSIIVPLPEHLKLDSEIELLDGSPVVSINFPIQCETNRKHNSLNLDKTPVIEGEVLGIKGQYLIFEHGVVNIRRHEGYIATVKIN